MVLLVPEVFPHKTQTFFIFKYLSVFLKNIFKCLVIVLHLRQYVNDITVSVGRVLFLGCARFCIHTPLVYILYSK